MTNKVKLAPALTGFCVTMVVSIVLCGVLAGVLLSGVGASDRMPVLAWAATAAACFAGSFSAARRADTMGLPIALLSVGLYLAVAFVLRGIFFQTVGEKAFITALFGIIAAFLGAVMATSRQNRPRRH